MLTVTEKLNWLKETLKRLSSFAAFISILLLIPSLLVQAQSSSINEEEESYINEDLIFSMYDDLIRFTKSDIPFIKEKEAIQNAHNSNQIDSCVTYTFKFSNIVLYELPKKVLPSKSVIKDSDLVFRSGIKIGVSKTTFDDIISKQTISDLVELTDLEYNTVFKFEFTNDTLSSINFSGYVD